MIVFHEDIECEGGTNIYQDTFRQQNQGRRRQ